MAKFNIFVSSFFRLSYAEQLKTAQMEAAFCEHKGMRLNKLYADFLLAHYQKETEKMEELGRQARLSMARDFLKAIKEGPKLGYKVEDKKIVIKRPQDAQELRKARENMMVWNKPKVSPEAEARAKKELLKWYEGAKEKEVQLDQLYWSNMSTMKKAKKKEVLKENVFKGKLKKTSGQVSAFSDLKALIKAA